MERLKQRIETAKKAFASFKDLVNQSPKDDVDRDASILRFQYTLEAIWKAYQHYLRSEAIDVASPKAVFREAFNINLIEENDIEAVLDMVSDRNLAVHTYNEKLANELLSRLPQYCLLFQKLLLSLENA